ncbi:ECF transporter S component [Kocuria carniphila]|uniref:ECF transporter S component n=1 Tax=Kocuria carniphila TaxID=262208 RepID=A0ABV3UZG2_9MICC|nr:ECF transporter S component [Kocuria carniphila]MCT1802219.1 ECF transporter S component [Kocuria carniphila]
MTQVKTRTTRTPQKSWRVVDIVVAAVLAAVCAVVFWAWANLLYPVATTAAVAYPPATGLIGGGWLIAGTLGALVIRKPGAAVFCELLAAVLEGFLGTHFGWTVVISGLVQGAAVEIVFLLTRYRKFGLAVAAAGGAMAGLFMGVSENIMYNFEWALDQQVVYASLTTLSGAIIAGVLMWLVTRALQKTGVLNGLASGAARR